MTTPTLATLTPLISIIAREATAHRPDLYADARQEGLITAWQVLADPAPRLDLRTYAIAAARRAIGNVLRGRPMTGAPRHQGRQDAADAGVLSLDALLQDPADPVAAAALASAETTAHATEISRALAGLSPADRLLVDVRFWRDGTFADVAAATGRPVGTCSRRWTEIVRPHLAAELAHLEGVAA